MNMRLPSLDAKTVIIVVSLLLLTLTFRVIDIDKPYETWDEITTYSVGLNLWYNILHGDFSPETWKTYSTDFSGSLHPPLVRYVYGLVNGAYIFSQTGSDLFASGYDDAISTMFALKNLAPGRALSAVFAAATTILVFLMARTYFGTRIAVISAATFALLPVSIAQTKIAALDAMLAFVYTMTIYFFLRGLRDRKYFYLSLLFSGFAIATKYNSVTLFGLLPLLYFVHRDKQVVKRRHLLLIPIVSVAVLFLIWPRLWPDPIGGALTNVNGWLSMGSGNVGEYFLGEFHRAQPVYYESVYILATTPALFLLLFFLGTAVALKKRKTGDMVFLLWFFMPLLIYSFWQFKMNGPRYVFMIYPAFSVFIGLGLAAAADYLRAKAPAGKTILYYAAFAAAFGSLIAADIAVHPYYLDYYNEFVGGPANAYERNLFTVGRWGEGIGEAAFYVYGHAEAGASVQFFVMPRHAIPPLQLHRDDLTEITPFIPKYLSAINDNENWDLTNVTAEADYVVENTYFRLYMNESFSELIAGDYGLNHVVDVQGAPLAWIYRRNSKTTNGIITNGG